MYDFFLRMGGKLTPKYFTRTVGGFLICAYGAGSFYPSLVADKEKAESHQDLGDATAVMFNAVTSGSTVAAMYIDMTPNTVVDKQFYNVSADRAAKLFAFSYPKKS